MYEKVNSSSDTFFILKHLDTLSIPKDLPDGRWKVFYNNDTSKVKYVFYLKNNKVSGPFNSYWENGSWAATGSFIDDSLWTFRYNLLCDKNLNFSTGLWGRRLSIDIYLPRELYYCPYNIKDSLYIDKWLYENGRLLSERVYHKTKGLIKETQFYKNGNKSSDFEKYSKYSIYTSWNEKQEISSVQIDQNFIYHLSLDSNRFNRNIIQTTYDSIGNVISNISIDKSGNITQYNDGKGVILYYDNEGKASEVLYNSRKGKFKIKKIK